MTKATMVEIGYGCVDGYHLFTSHEIKGLFIGSSDCEKAFHDVANAIQILMKANHDIDCTAQPMQTFEEFVEANDVTNYCSPRTYQLMAA